jgi:hypothetical protein
VRDLALAASLVGGALALPACSRSPGSTPDAGSEPAQTALDAAPPAPATDAAGAFPHVEEPPPATYVGARRVRLTKLDDEPGLARSADVIRTHFGGALPPAMDLQAVPLGGGRQTLLLSAAAPDPDPIALLIDATGAPLWIKPHPLGGIAPPARPLALAPRPDEGAALFVYDEPTKLLAARMWAENGDAYAELVIFSLARCDALSAAWWPGHGWIVVASFPGGARAQLVGEEGGHGWGPDGLPVGEPWRAPAPATIAIDPATSSWLLVQHATRGGGDHVVALRYGAFGERLTAAPADLGPEAVTHPSDRIDASLVRPGVVRVAVGARSADVKVDALK